MVERGIFLGQKVIRLEGFRVWGRRSLRGKREMALWRRGRGLSGGRWGMDRLGEGCSVVWVRGLSSWRMGVLLEEREQKKWRKQMEKRHDVQSGIGGALYLV